MCVGESMSINEALENSLSFFNFTIKNRLENALGAVITNVQKEQNYQCAVLGEDSLSISYKDERDNSFIAYCKVLQVNSDEINDELIVFAVDSNNLSKLLSSYELILQAVPCVLPRKLCLARVYESSCGLTFLNDILIIDTCDLLKYAKTHDLKGTFFITKKLLDEEKISYSYENLNSINDKVYLENSTILYESKDKSRKEINQMQNFIVEVEKKKLAKYVEMIFYNSTKNYCILELSDDYDLKSEINFKLKALASKYIENYIFTKDCEKILSF